MALFTVADRARIEEAIASAEARTSGEVVVAVVRQSADYALPRASIAVLTAVGIGILVNHLAPGLGADWLLVGVVPVAAAAYALWGWAPLLRLVVPGGIADAAARLRAQTLFAQNGLHHTRERTGLLVLVSEREHRVVVLGDDGIDAVVGEDGWREYVAELVTAIRSGRAADGLVETVGRIGEVLAAQFPRRADDVNELPNRVLDDS